MPRLKRFLTPPLIVVASLLMWIEESLWIGLKQLTRWIAVLPLVRQLEMLILRLPPYWTMFVFLLPMTILFPVKLLAVYWLACGYWFFSVALLLFAKVFSTAIVARMYVVCQPKLMTIKWFSRLHDWLIATRDQLYAAVRAMPFYQAIKASLASIKFAARQLLAKLRGQRGIWARWRAIRRLHRQKNRIFSAAEKIES